MKKPVFWITLSVLTIVWGTECAVDGIMGLIRCVTSALLGANIVLDLYEE